ncbi:MAG: phosphate regulon sensor histidine kinase PhoR [Oceanococcus sp.]
MLPATRFELFRLFLCLLVGGFVGGVLGHVTLGALLALLLLFFNHLRHADALLKWMDAPKKNELPDGDGIWRTINHTSWERRKQARKRKKQLSGIVSEFRASTAALPDAAVVLDAQLRISWFNQAAREMLALESKRDAGLRIAHLLRHPEFSAYLQKAHSENDAGLEIPAPANADQTLWIRVIAYGQGQKLLIARDVTQLKLLEQSRRDFVANASHELRTPLTVIRGYLDMMSDDSEQAEHSALGAWQQPLGEMLSQAGRMQKIISDLLKLANLETNNKRSSDAEVDMAALIGACLDEARILSKEQHELKLELVENLNILGNQSELHAVISNLLSNALRYTPAGGCVTLRWLHQKSGALLQVSDTGIGISAIDLPRLTERFYRADAARSRETGGTGLGLAIVKHALERHDATLRISSQVGTGSTFHCEFLPHRVLTKPKFSAEI